MQSNTNDATKHAASCHGGCATSAPFECATRAKTPEQFAKATNLRARPGSALISLFCLLLSFYFKQMARLKADQNYLGEAAKYGVKRRARSAASPLPGTCYHELVMSLGVDGLAGNLPKADSKA